MARLLELNALLHSDVGLHRGGSVVGLIGDEGVHASRLVMHMHGYVCGCVGYCTTTTHTCRTIVHLDDHRARSMPHVDGLGAADDALDRRSLGHSVSELGDLEFDNEARLLRAAERQVC